MRSTGYLESNFKERRPSRRYAEHDPSIKGLKIVLKDLFQCCVAELRNVFIQYVFLVEDFPVVFVGLFYLRELWVLFSLHYA